jgi:uncharacterized membrane protein YphA (DoxX/SURF4 family)
MRFLARSLRHPQHRGCTGVCRGHLHWQRLCADSWRRSCNDRAGLIHRLGHFLCGFYILWSYADCAVPVGLAGRRGRADYDWTGRGFWRAIVGVLCVRCNLVGRVGDHSCLAGSAHGQVSLRDENVLLTAVRQIASAGLAIGLGGMWLWAGISKLRSPASLANMRRLIGGPSWLSLVIARAVPIIEIALGIAMLMRQWVREAAFISFVLLISFTIVLGIEYFRRSLAGLDPGTDCGCFGGKLTGMFPLSKLSWEIHFGQTANYGIAASNVVRPLVLAMIAWTVAFASSNGCACQR